MNQQIKELLSKRDADWRFPGGVYENFCALSTIARHDKSLLYGEPLGKIMAFLVSIEEKPGGPYFSQHGFIDRATNACIASFLSIYDIYLPALKPFISNAKSDNSKLKCKGDPYTLSTTFGCKGPPYTLSTGNHPEQTLPKKTVWTKDEQKIMLGIRKCFKEHLASLPLDLRKPANRIFEKTIAGNRDKQMPLISYYFRLALEKQGAKIGERLIEKLGMVNIFFWSAFIIYDDFWDQDEKAEPLLLPVANMFARYHATFFESAFTELLGLSAPTVSSKLSAATPQHAPNLEKIFHHLMDNLDAANVWEMKYCRAEIKESIFHVPKKLPRYGDYTRKYEPASGHILGPLLLLFLTCKNTPETDSTDSAKCKGPPYTLSTVLGCKGDPYTLGDTCVLKFFKHLLISMQLSDDMHDFEEDLKRGHISTAVDLLLRTLPQKKKTIDLKKDLPEIKKIFWFKVLPKLAKKTITQAKKSRQALYSLKTNKSLADTSLLEHLISIYEKTGQQALTEHKNSLAFVNAYQNAK